MWLTTLAVLCFLPLVPLYWLRGDIAVATRQVRIEPTAAVHLAILLAALVLWGFKPGPLFIPENPALFWGLVASMYIGNVMLLILNLPLVPLFAQVLRTPAHLLYPLVFGVSIVGVYSVSSSLFDLGLLLAFGLLGYAMRKLDFPAAPLVLGVVLGAPMERALRQSLMMSEGSLGILLTRPISATMLLLALVILLAPAFGKINRWRLQAIEQDEP